MKNFLIGLLFIFSAMETSAWSHAAGQDEILSIRKGNFNSGWRFQRGEHPEASNASFDDSQWEAVKTPHDWSIEGPIEANSPSGRQGGYYPCGVGYYRKTFAFDPAWKDRLVQITFDGIMSDSEVWINGRLLGKRPNGYVGFTYDLTPHLQDGDNVIAVRADNAAQPNSRWYTGCGIYRNVWLIVCNKVSVAQHGTYVIVSNVTADSAAVQIETSIRNSAATVIAESIVNTASKPARIQLIADKNTVAADGVSCVHVECNVLDQEGNFVPNANNLITFKISGPADNIGVDNGDPLDLASTKINERRAFNGKCLLILQSQQQAGLVAVEAVSDGLSTERVEITARNN